MQDRRVDRADLQLDAAGVVEFFRERDLVPGKDGFAHVDGDRAILMLDGVQNAGDGLEGEALAGRFTGKRLDHAARAVAHRPGLEPSQFRMSI